MGKRGKARLCLRLSAAGDYSKTKNLNTLHYYVLHSITMETISLRLEGNFLKDIERIMRKHRYATKTEFVRAAIRDKMQELEKKETLRAIERIAGSSKRKTSDEELHRARQVLEKEYEKRIK